MYKFLLGHIFSIHLDIYLSLELLSHTLNIFRNCQTIFQSNSTVLHSYQQCIRIPVLHILANLCYYPSFFIIAILEGMKWYPFKFKTK